MLFKAGGHLANFFKPPVLLHFYAAADIGRDILTLTWRNKRNLKKIPGAGGNRQPEFPAGRRPATESVLSGRSTVWKDFKPLQLLGT